MFTKTTQRILKQHRLSPQELCFCTMFLSGFSLGDSYLMAFQPMTNKSAGIMTDAKKMAAKAYIKGYIAYKQNGQISAVAEEESATSEEMRSDDFIDSPILDKQQMIKSLTLLIEKTADTKLKSELIMKLADLTGAKREQIETEEDAIHYYIPLTCKICPKNKN